MLFPLFSILILGVPVGVATLVRSAVKPLAMVGVTGLLSIGCVSMSASMAEADAGLLLPIIEGATEAILPEVMEAEAAAGPVGWGLLALTTLAATTKDYWVPYVVGAFGQSTQHPNDPAPANEVYNPGTVPPAGMSADAVAVYPGLALVENSTVPVAGKWWLNSDSTYKGDPTKAYSSFTVAAAYEIDCKASNGTTKLTQGWQMYGVNEGHTDIQHSQVQVSCPNATDVPLGLVLGASGAAPELLKRCTDSTLACGKWGPGNVIRWGTLLTGTPAFDPHSSDTKYHVSVECVRDDGTRATLSQDSSGDVGAVKVPSCADAGLGHNDGKFDVTGTPPGQTQPTPLWNHPAVDDPNHSLCNPINGGPLCKLQIMIDGKPCVEGQVECVRWASLAQTDPTRVKCFYGPYEVALSNCNMLERAYEIGGVPANTPNTDGDPSTRSGAGPTGQPQPGNQPGSNPDPNAPQAGPGTIAPPIPGTSGAPKPGDSPESKDCFPTGWGVLNPVEWVFKPTQCALKWAFVPDSATMTDLQTKVQADIDHVGFGPLQTAVVGMFGPVGSGGSGCSGPPITFAMDGQSQTVHPFDACTAPMSTAAAICNALFTVVFTVGGGLALLRAISSAFGYNFSFGRSSAGADA